MIKINTKFVMKVPSFDFTDDLHEIAEKIFIPSIQNGIDIRAAIDGTQLPSNEPATIKRKGHDRPLINTGALRASLYKLGLGKNKVMVTLGAIRKNIGEYLQIDGIQTNSGPKFYRFFGVNKTMNASAVGYMARKVSERIHGTK